MTSYDANGTPSNFTDDVAVHDVTYAYDADNRLIRRIVDPDGDTGSDPLEQTVFIHHDGQIVLQFDGIGPDDLPMISLSHRYLWGPGVDMLLADEQVAWNSANEYLEGTTYWTLGDHLGSIRDVVDGEVRLHRAYDSFGNVVDETHFNASGVSVNERAAGYVDV